MTIKNVEENLYHRVLEYLPRLCLENIYVLFQINVIRKREKRKNFYIKIMSFLGHKGVKLYLIFAVPSWRINY
jgi:hypothetical protein